MIEEEDGNDDLSATITKRDVLPAFNGAWPECKLDRPADLSEVPVGSIFSAIIFSTT